MRTGRNPHDETAVHGRAAPRPKGRWLALEEDERTHDIWTITFVLDAIAQKGSEERRATARGRDIYAITAPIVVEAAQRIVSGMVKTTGVVTAGEIFDAQDFLRSLSPSHLTRDWVMPPTSGQGSVGLQLAPPRNDGKSGGECNATDHTAGKSRGFHRLHGDGGILVLVNAWDAASARLFEQAGSPAIATTSAGMAWSLGYSDGQQVSRRELVEACARICRVVTAPVSVDIERGFGQTPAEVSATVRALLELGVVGINIEDGVIPDTRELAPPDVLTENISAIRAVAEELGGRLFINARTDTYFTPADDPVARYEDTVRRARMYVAAGADGIFVPGLADLDEIARMAKAVERPLNIYAGYAGLPPVDELRRAGVRRLSLGCGPFQAALALARRIATETLGEGTYTAMTTDMLSAREADSLFSKA